MSRKKKTVKTSRPAPALRPPELPPRVYAARALMELKAEAAVVALRESGSREVSSVSHLLPRAVCVAKTGLWAAVFAVCPLDREPLLVFGEPFVVVRNKTAAPVKPGDWCSLAYVCTPGCQQFYVVRHLLPPGAGE